MQYIFDKNDEMYLEVPGQDTQNICPAKTCGQDHDGTHSAFLDVLWTQITIAHRCHGIAAKIKPEMWQQWHMYQSVAAVESISLLCLGLQII